MLTISNVQWKALTEAGFKDFETEMVQHLRGFAPELAQVMGTERLHALVVNGVERARSHGFTLRGPVRTYLETMIALGSEFDTDPVFARATIALQDTEGEEFHRADALHAGVVAYYAQVFGPRNEHLLSALEIARVLLYETSSTGIGLDARAIAHFRDDFPEKFAYAGEEALRGLAATAANVSDEFGVTSEAGTLLIAQLMFAFGHGVFADPAYAWASDTMRDTSVGDAEERARHLYRKTRLYLAAALKHLAN